MWQEFPASTTVRKAQIRTINCGLFHGEIDASATSSVTALSHVRAQAVPVAQQPALGGARRRSTLRGRRAPRLSARAGPGASKVRSSKSWGLFKASVISRVRVHLHDEVLVICNVKIQQDVYAESTQGDEKERESESKGERERAKKARQMSCTNDCVLPCSHWQRSRLASDSSSLAAKRILLQSIDRDISKLPTRPPQFSCPTKSFERLCLVTAACLCACLLITGL